MGVFWLTGRVETSTAHGKNGIKACRIGWQRKRPQVVEWITSLFIVDCLGGVPDGGPREGLFTSPRALPALGLALASLSRNLLIVALRE